MAKRTNPNPRSPQPAAKAPVTAAAKVAPSPLAKKPFDWMAPAGAALIAAGILFIYWPSLNGTWLWDDDYLTPKKRHRPRSRRALEHLVHARVARRLLPDNRQPGVARVAILPRHAALLSPHQRPPAHWQRASRLAFIPQARAALRLAGRPILCHPPGHGRVRRVDGRNQKHALDDALPPRPLRLDRLRPPSQYRALSPHPRPFFRPPCCASPPC